MARTTTGRKQVIDELELPVANAEAVIEKAIEFGVYTDDMPTSKKDKNAAAHEIVAFAIDSYVSDGVTPDADDEGVAEAGEQIVEIFKLAGVEVGDDDEIEYGDPPALDGEAADDNGDDGDDEAPIDIEDIIEGYPELTPATKLKKIKALELDPEDDDDYDTLAAIADWEEAQDEPSSRVLSWLEDQIGEEVDGEAEGGDDDETADDAGDGEDESGEGDEEDGPYTEAELSEMEKDELFEVADEFELDKPKRLTDAGKQRLIAAILEAQDGDEEGDGEAEGDDGDGELEEPWEGYEDAKIADIKEVLNDDERTVEELEYIKDYEASREGARAAIISLCNKRIKELSDDEGDEPEPEPEPAKKSARRGRRGKTEDPDDNDDVDNAVAKDDEKDAKKAAELVAEYEVTINFAGEKSVTINIDGKHAALGIVADALESDAEVESVEFVVNG